MSDEIKEIGENNHPNQHKNNNMSRTPSSQEPLQKARKKVDNVNHPPHYKKHPSGIECIQVTEHMNFNLGNAVKYIWRADERGKAIEDLEKARWYIQREIKRRVVEDLSDL